MSSNIVKANNSDFHKNTLWMDLYDKKHRPGLTEISNFLPYTIMTLFYLFANYLTRESALKGKILNNQSISQKMLIVDIFCTFFNFYGSYPHHIIRFLPSCLFL